MVSKTEGLNEVQSLTTEYKNVQVLIENHSSYPEPGRSQTERKRQSPDSNIKMTDVRTDKNFSTAIIKTLQGAIRNKLDELREMPSRSSGP